MSNGQEDALAAALADVLECQARLAAAEGVTTEARDARNAAIVRALRSGVTAYRIAQVLGLSQTAVAKIRSRG